MTTTDFLVVRVTPSRSYGATYNVAVGPERRRVLARVATQAEAETMAAAERQRLARRKSDLRIEVHAADVIDIPSLDCRFQAGDEW